MLVLIKVLLSKVFYDFLVNFYFFYFFYFFLLFYFFVYRKQYIDRAKESLRLVTEPPVRAARGSPRSGPRRAPGRPSEGIFG